MEKNQVFNYFTDPSKFAIFTTIGVLNKPILLPLSDFFGNLKRKYNNTESDN